MSDLLRYVLSNFWPFIGALILITTLGGAIAEIIKAFGYTVRAFRRTPKVSDERR